VTSELSFLTKRSYLLITEWITKEPQKLKTTELKGMAVGSVFRQLIDDACNFEETAKAVGDQAIAIARQAKALPEVFENPSQDVLDKLSTHIQEKIRLLWDGNRRKYCRKNSIPLPKKEGKNTDITGDATNKT